MKLSNAILFLSSLYSTFATVQAGNNANEPFVMPDEIEMSVKVLHGEICDADGFMLGDSDGYVRVSVTLYDDDGNKNSYPCGVTNVVKNDNSPVWDKTLKCGKLKRSEWKYARLYFSMVDKDRGGEEEHDGLGKGWYKDKAFKYGELSTPEGAKVTSARGSVCGTSTVWFTVIIPKKKVSFCIQPDPMGPFRKETIRDGYYQIQQALNGYEEQNYEIGYAGDTKTIDGEQVILDEKCNHKEFVEVTLCHRAKGEYGDAGLETMDESLLSNQKKFYRDLGFDTFSPGDKVNYLDGKGIVQDDCTVKPEGATTFGDPHFVTWNGEMYDFHGGCDLVLLQHPGFKNGLGLNVHVRTKIHSWWSSIESAVVQIGDNSLQITGGAKSVKYWLDGVEQEMETGDAVLGDFGVHFYRASDHQSRTRVDLGNHADAVGIETYKHFVRVNFKDAKHVSFNGSNGLLGNYPSGKMLGRDGKIIRDANEFGQEWMVRPTDRILFNDVDANELPKQCAMPLEAPTAEEARREAMAARRRLGQAELNEDDALMACARVRSADRDACVFDVLATQDKDIAGSY